MVATSTKRPTRVQRDAARRAATAANDSMDLRPLGRASFVVLLVVVLWAAAAVFVPGGRPFGGPLQSSRPESSASLSVLRKTHGRPVTFGLAIPWNVGPGTAVLEGVAPIGAEGVEMIGAGVVALGSPAVSNEKGFPPQTAVVTPVEEFPIGQGSNDLDGFQIVVGLRGEGMVPAFALTYRLGGVRHVAIFGYGVMLCAGRCDVPEQEARERQHGVLGSLAPFIAPPDR